jgi:hypothetical protein
MIPEVITSAVAMGSTVAVKALLEAIKRYNNGKDDGRDLVSFSAEGISETGDSTDSSFDLTDKVLRAVILERPELLRQDESPVEASRSTKEVITEQLTILEKERNRLIPLAAREHWVAIIFAILAGLVFFTGIALVIFGTITKAIVTLIATTAPGFLSKVFYSREAIVEKRIEEISADLRESEKTKERLETLEEALRVIPEEYRERVLEDFTKKSRLVESKPRKAKAKNNPKQINL